MVFSSILFIFVYLPLTLLVYFLVPFKYKNVALLACSLVFYAWGEPVYVILMILNILFNYVMGMDIQLKKDMGQKKRAKLSLILTLVVNFGLLGFFKYYVFFITNLNAILPVDIPVREIALPIGISFYTFQTLSYIIDVYNGKIKAQRSPVVLGTYVTMFPQLIAGPIVQYSDVEAQMQQREMSLEKFGSGMKRFIVGLAKKVLLANTAGAVFNDLTAMNLDETSILTGWLLIIAYTFQIYFDFSGYSDMAIGLGRMMGFEFKENFDYPYISKSAEEFWRRWHISLGSWFRDYVYFPLGGSYVSKGKHIRNVMIVWMLTGFWHGAAWNFVIWGLYYGIILTIEKQFLLKRTTRTPGIVMHIYTMLIVMVGWVIFCSTDMGMCFDILSSMFNIIKHPLVDGVGMYYLTANLILGGIMACCSTPVMKTAVHYVEQKWPKASGWLITVGGVVLFLLCIAYLVNESYNPFLYFRF